MIQQLCSLVFTQLIWNFMSTQKSLHVNAYSNLIQEQPNPCDVTSKLNKWAGVSREPSITRREKEACYHDTERTAGCIFLKEVRWEKKRRHRVGFQPYGGKNEYLAALGEERGREEEAGHGAFQVCEMIWYDNTIVLIYHYAPGKLIKGWNTESEYCWTWTHKLLIPSTLGKLRPEDLKFRVFGGAGVLSEILSQNQKDRGLP